ncbi:HNH endonuclease [Saccharopolyspora shandongensis]|uniref:HNH endonuclease n=1 Tax=Saccharopolyspora shandongensis TaxID=418495 RepID=UPI000B829E6A|nr:HNH endonuclease signature motif containing protein [Saccharopolyspora shandongensis]
MTWESGDPKKSGRRFLPKNWPSLRRQVLKRDPTCKLATPGICTGTSEEVDHIGSRDNHELTNLQGVCRRCHGRKTSQQGNDAQAARKAARRNPRLGGHPGRRK